MVTEVLSVKNVQNYAVLVIFYAQYLGMNDPFTANETLICIIQFLNVLCNDDVYIIN